MKVKKERMKKEIALLLGIVMIATVFAALPTASAWNIPSVATDNSRGDNMVEIVGYIANSDPFYPGQQDRTVQIQLYNRGEVPVALNRVMITAQSVRGPDGAVTTTAIHWDVDTDNGPGGTGYTINVFNTQLTTSFQFDIDPDQANVPPGTYNITFKIDYEYDDDNNGATADVADSEIEYIEFDIAANIDVSDAQPALYAGQTFTDLNIHVDDSWSAVQNLYLNLSNIPTGITFDSTTGWTSNAPLPAGGATIGYKVDVSKDMAPGIYTIDYTTQYTNPDGVWCTETGTLDITVEFTPVIEAALTGTNITINQGDAAIQALGVTFTNTGNVNLRNIDISLDYDGYFFFAATDYYEGYTGTGSQNPVQITDIHVDSLDMGANTEGQWYVAANPYVQAGDHRILFDWTATFFDNGATNHPTHYVDVTLDWTGANPMTPRCSLDPGNEWIAGPYVMINVVDNHPDFSAGKIQNEDTNDDYFDLSWNDLTDVEVSSTIHNFELVDFTDLSATLQVGVGTPFWDPLNHSSTTVENDLADSDDTIGAQDDAEIWWHVDINPNTQPGIYTVDIVLTGRNADTTEYITTTIQAVVEVRGFGPELVVTGVTTGDITPGEIFYLNLTIQNLGDDTARDVFVSIPGQIGYNWDVIDGFVSAISSNDNNKMVSVPNGYYDNYSYYWPGWGYYSEEYIEDGSLNKTASKNTEYSGVTLEQLNISDAKDIVDLALYIEGVFNSPTPEIWLMKADNVAPGQSITLSFKMKTNINMVEGRPYVIQVVTAYTDSYGDGPDMNLETQDITIRTTNPGTPYHGTPTTTENAGALSNENLMLLGLILLVILLIIVGVALAGSRGGKKKKKEPEETAYAPEPLPPEEGEIAPEELEDPSKGGMGPGPGYEEGEPGFELEEKEGETSF